MLGDILLITEKHKKAAELIVDLTASIEQEKVLIAVGGESGSGKSELAHSINRIMKTRGKKAKTIHSDNYYRIPPKDRTAWRKNHGVESVGLEEYDWDKLNKNISEFYHDEKTILPCIDLLTDQVDQLYSDFRGIQYLIIDGLYALALDADMRIFIDLSFHETKKAQRVRGKETQNEFRLKILQQEHKIVRSLKRNATHLVDRNFDVIEIDTLST